MNQGGNPMASVAWIEQNIHAKVKNDINVKPSALADDVYREYGVRLKYNKIWRAKDMVMRQIRGTYDESFAFIPSYCRTILTSNPGSIARYRVEEGGFFKRIFIAFHASLVRFLNGCYPIIGVDGTFLKGQANGMLLTAVSLDGNNQLFPIAIAIVEKETTDSWTFFLECLKDGLKGKDHFTFMSDRQKGLKKEIEGVFPSSYHQFCMRHFYANVHRYWKGILIRDYFWTASRAYTRFEFDDTMDKICEIEPAARDYIDEIHPKHWSRAFFPDDLPCNMNQNNFTESFNRMIIEVRSLPICGMLEWIRRKLMSNMQSRRSKKWTGKVSPKIQHILDERAEKCRLLELGFAGNDIFEILEWKPFGQDVRHIVKVDARTCTCRQWQVEGIPCIHAINALLYKRKKPADFCHEMYSREKYEAIYAPILFPLPDKRMWEPPASFVVNPPRRTRQAGRPKKK